MSDRPKKSEQFFLFNSIAKIPVDIFFLSQQIFWSISFSYPNSVWNALTKSIIDAKWKFIVAREPVSFIVFDFFRSKTLSVNEGSIFWASDNKLIHGICLITLWIFSSPWLGLSLKSIKMET